MMYSTETNYRYYGDEFSRLSKNLERVDFCLRKICENSTEGGLAFNTFIKSNNKAVELRLEGNVRFRKQKYLRALELYTESLAWAQGKPVLALSYANRSAVLFKLGLFQECLSDIQRALDCGYPEESKEKLISRKRESEILLALQVYKSQPSVPTKMAPSVVIQSNEKYGRHAVATQKIEVGEFLLLENPLASVLLKDLFIHCHECKNLCYDSIPCYSCPKALYCGPECRDKAYQNYHRYECCLLDGVDSLKGMTSTLTIALRGTLQIMTELKQQGSSGLYKNLKRFVTHADKDTPRMRFTISWATASIFYLLKLKTSLFSDHRRMENMFKRVFPWAVRITHVNGVLVNRLQPHHKQRYQMVNYASGLYCFYSSFNHSCYPNAFFYHDGVKLVVRALSTIRRGEQIFISYGETYSTVPKAARQLSLKSRFHFVCGCVACEGNWPEDKRNADVDEAFAEPFAIVNLAIGDLDHELLESIVPIFVARMQNEEQPPPACPSRALNYLRQLVVDCLQKYENPRIIAPIQ